MAAQESKPVSERVTLVTGATRGIGRAIAEKLAAQNHRVLGIARKKGDDGFPGELFVADLRDTESVKRALTDIISCYEITGLVNNAGFNHLRNSARLTLIASMR
jgi:3-oxoacyl-[acyl-carrier protein] reductase